MILNINMMYCKYQHHRKIKYLCMFALLNRGRIGFDSIGCGWCKHAVRCIISTLI